MLFMGGYTGTPPSLENGFCNDELPGFFERVLEALRQLLGAHIVSRSAATASFFARCQLSALIRAHGLGHRRGGSGAWNQHVEPASKSQEARSNF